MCVVTGIGFFITVFSAGYMKGEAGYFRFFAYLGLFIFAMTCLVMGNNLIMLYLGWEGVGLCSYLLIGYYYERPAAREAAKKAFLVNRIGDFGFGLGIMLCFLAFGTVSYFGRRAATYRRCSNWRERRTSLRFKLHRLKWIPFLLMLGAFGKSAQFPLYVWLPDAMEGPTPVSALIHAATMVTAGVYMIARCGTLFFGNSAAMMTIAVVGLFHRAVCRDDRAAAIRSEESLRVFDDQPAWASCSSALGARSGGRRVPPGDPRVLQSAAVPQLRRGDARDGGRTGHAQRCRGLKRVLPKTRWLMLIGCLALAGFPPFSGFFSKDEIVGAAWAMNRFIAAVMLFAAFLTAYYTFRLYFRVFEGPEILPEPPKNPMHVVMSMSIWLTTRLITGMMPTATMNITTTNRR